MNLHCQWQTFLQELVGRLTRNVMYIRATTHLPALANRTSCFLCCKHTNNTSGVFMFHNLISAIWCHYVLESVWW